MGARRGNLEIETDTNVEHLTKTDGGATKTTRRIVHRAARGIFLVGQSQGREVGAGAEAGVQSVNHRIDIVVEVEAEGELVSLVSQPACK